MGYGRQSRQNRKENSDRNWTFRLHKMQKNLPHHPKQKEDLRLFETVSTPTPSFGKKIKLRIETCFWTAKNSINP